MINCNMLFVHLNVNSDLYAKPDSALTTQYKTLVRMLDDKLLRES